MRNKTLTSILIVAGLMLVYAIVYAVSVDVYGALFWSRLFFGDLLIGLAAFGGFRAVRQKTMPLKIRAFCILVLYALGMLAVLCCAKNAKTVTILSIILTAVDVLVHFLDAGIARHQA